MSFTVTKTGRAPCATCFTSSKCAGQHDLANRAANGLPDARVFGEIRSIANELIGAFRQRADLCSGPLISSHFVRVFLLGRKQLREARQPVGNVGVAQDRLVRDSFHSFYSLSRLRISTAG